MTTPIYDRNGRYRGFREDDGIYSRSGVFLGFVDGASVWAKDGRYVGELQDQMVVDKHRVRGHRAARVRTNRAGRSYANRAGRATAYQDAFDRLERRRSDSA